MTVATLGMAGKDAGYFLEAEPIGIADILYVKGEEKERKIKDDSGSSILTTCWINGIILMGGM